MFRAIWFLPLRSLRRWTKAKCFPSSDRVAAWRYSWFYFGCIHRRICYIMHTTSLTGKKRTALHTSPQECYWRCETGRPKRHYAMKVLRGALLYPVLFCLCLFNEITTLTSPLVSQVCGLGSVIFKRVPLLCSATWIPGAERDRLVTVLSRRNVWGGTCIEYNCLGLTHSFHCVNIPRFTNVQRNAWYHCHS